jgi:uncharacterized protein YdhG (YjbR/CyaY superfamily)
LTHSKDAFASFPEEQATALGSVFDTLAELLPASTQDLTWGMPTFRCEGIVLVSLWGFQRHNSLFPGPGAITLMGDALDGYTVTKGTIHFDAHKAPPKSFLRAVVGACITAANATYPKKSGRFIELYGNGVLKAKGTYRGGQMHGDWKFFRKDGTLMRSGRFRDGSRTGSWVTHDREGQPYKTTVFP